MNRFCSHCSWNAVLLYIVNIEKPVFVQKSGHSSSLKVCSVQTYVVCLFLYFSMFYNLFGDLLTIEPVVFLFCGSE